LTFARQRRIQPRHIDIAEIIHTIMMLATHQLEMAGVRYQIRLPDTSFQAWGDYALIQQCLMNLIFNALDAMPKGGRITVSGGYCDAGDQVWLTISDTGHGIHPDDLPRIFEPFYSTKENGKGVGLGLSMVYGIIREHHGTVTVESEPDKGTAFRITLPIHPPVGQAD
jgi:signal transduction histidine kinase